MRNKVLNTIAAVLVAIGFLFLLREENTTTEQMTLAFTNTCVYWFLALLCYMGAMRKENKQITKGA